MVPGKPTSAYSSTSRETRSRWFVGSSRASSAAGRTSIRARATPRLLAAGQDGHLLVDGVAREEERAQDGAQPRLGQIGRHRLQLLERGARGIEGVELMLGVVVHGHVGAERALAPLERQHAGQDHAEQVDLPAPLSPTSATRSPRSTSTFTPA